MGGNVGRCWSYESLQSRRHSTSRRPRTTILSRRGRDEPGADQDQAFDGSARRPKGKASRVKSESMGPAITVVTSAMITSIEKMRVERIPMSYPILSAIYSMRPREFMRAPSCRDSRQPMPLKRAASEPAPSFPRMATEMIKRHTKQL